MEEGAIRLKPHPGVEAKRQWLSKRVEEVGVMMDIDALIAYYHLEDYFEDIEKYRCGMKVITLPRKSYVYSKLEDQKYAFFLLEGRMQVNALAENGKYLPIRYCDEPIFFGEMELLGYKQHSKVIETETECTFLAIDLSLLKNSLLQDLKFLLFLCQNIAEKLYNTESLQLRNVEKSAHQKIVAYLKQKAKYGVFKENIQKTCENIGVSRRHLYRILDEYIEAGYIERTKNGYLLKNIDELEKNLEKNE